MQVILVSFAVGVAVLLAFALVGLSARVRRPAGGPADGARPRLGATTGTAIAALCLAGVVAIVGYGLYLIVA